MISGIIVKGIGGLYYVAIGRDIIQCKVRGIFRYEGITPMVGDYVEIEPEKKVIQKILPRKNALIRPSVANIDQLGIIFSAKEPEPDLLLVDKLILFALINNIKPLIIINKTDLACKDEIDFFVNMYQSADFCIMPMSAKMGINIDELFPLLQNKITAFAGQSGVGKSSILNLLNPKFNRETGEVSKKVKRGKHTTRHVELMMLSQGGMIADTPGFSVVRLDSLVSQEQIQFYYPEFLPYIDQCYYSGCLHYREPRCKIQQIVEDGIICKERYNRYIEIIEEITGSGRGVQW